MGGWMEVCALALVWEWSGIVGASGGRQVCMCAHVSVLPSASLPAVSLCARLSSLAACTASLALTQTGMFE